jgi:signal transduction histidine kinase/ActR/RegA family two-component response regulator
VIGHTALELGLWADPAQRLALVAALERDGQASVDANFRLKSGGLLFGHLRARIVDWGGGRSILSVTRDMSEHARLAQQLQSAQKLQSLGALAGGIAHDFNNLLTAIEGNLELARLSSAEPGQLPERYIDEATRAVIRSRDLTQQLLRFSKGGQPKRSVVLLAPIVEEAVRFALVGRRNTCKLLLPDALWPVEVDPGQIGQVVNNLVINADEAMTTPGTIVVAAENAHVAGDSELPVGAGPYVRLRVSDSGVGMPPEVAARVFDTFFTTKERGTGLGLATVHSIVNAHGGAVLVDSIPGRGSTFTVYLHALPEWAQPNRDAAPSSRGSVAPRLRVLVLDDDDNVRGLLSEVLRLEGHDVVAAAEGGAALSLVQQADRDGRPFDVAILDLTISHGMGGRDVRDRLAATAPEVRCIATSGDSTDPIMLDPAQFGFAAQLPKPWRQRDLDRVLRHAMRMPRQPPRA